METLGKYALLEQLSSGETSDIFFAKSTEKKDAEGIIVKRLKPSMGEDKAYLKAFLEGAKLSSQLDHPNISKTHDFGLVDNQHFLARQYGPGKDLKTLARRHSVQRRLLPQPATLHIISKVMDALEFAHAKGTHGCLTPSDVLIGFQGEVTIINFGPGAYCSRKGAAKPSLSKDKQSYLAPEHISGGAIDARTDIYSLGTIFYELLTGNVIFPEGIDAATIAAVKEKAVTPPSGVRPTISATLDAIVMKAIAIDPVHRYASIAELKKDFSSALKEGLEIGSAGDIAALMTRIFPNESSLERERKALVIPAGLGTVAPKGGSGAREVPKAAPQVEAVAPLASEPPKKSNGLYIGIGVVVVLIIGIGAFFALKSPPPETAALTSDNSLKGGAGNTTDKVTPEPKAEPTPTPAPAPPVDQRPTPEPKTTIITPPTPTPTEPATSPDRGRNARAKTKPAHYARPNRPTPPPPQPAPKIEVAQPLPVPKVDPKPKAEPKLSPTKPEWTAPAAKPALAESGFLKIVSSTPIDIEVDGWKSAVTSGSLNLKLTPGTHSLKVIFRENGKSFVRSVDISPGKSKVLRLVRGQ
jgi:eukaryotic-like serine/threonine-protein kinase